MFDICHNTVREGDGRRVYALWKYDFLLFKEYNHKNYSILAFDLVAKKEPMVSEREAHQLIHNRFINQLGGIGHNIPLDLALEFINKEVKPKLKILPTLTDQVVERTGI